MPSLRTVTRGAWAARDALVKPRNGRRRRRRRPKLTVAAGGCQGTEMPYARPVRRAHQYAVMSRPVAAMRRSLAPVARPVVRGM